MCVRVVVLVYVCGCLGVDVYTDVRACLAFNIVGHDWQKPINVRCRQVLGAGDMVH